MEKTKYKWILKILKLKILNFLHPMAFLLNKKKPISADTNKAKYGLTGISKLLVHCENQQAYGPYLIIIEDKVYLQDY